MFSSLLVLTLAALAPFAHANVFITNPIASSSFAAGSAQTVTWQDDGSAPTLASFGPASIGLYAGNQNQQTLLQLISASVDVSKTTSQTWTPDATVGPNFSSYFIRFTSLSLKDSTNSQFPAEAFSAKFALSGMTGTFNATVQAQITGSSSPSSASAAPATAAVTSGSGLATQRVSTTSASSASTVKASTASTAGANSKNNGAGHMVVHHVLGAAGVATIVFAFFL